MKSAQLLEALITRLGLIRTRNGYQTDAGLRVYRTLIGMPMPDNLILPALFVRMTGNALDASNRMNRLDTRETFSLTIEGAVAVSGTTAPDSALLALLWDIRAALLPDTAISTLLHGNEPLQWDAATFQLPEGGAALATVIQPLTLRYAERYSLT